MDSDVLVEPLKSDGRRFIAHLTRAGIPVLVAFWVKSSPEGLWNLYVASNAVEGRGLAEAYRLAFAELEKLPGNSVTPSGLSLLSGSSPMALAAVAVRDRYPSREMTVVRGKGFASFAAAEATFCIYPTRFQLPIRALPDGSWQVQMSELDDIWLTCESEVDARSIAAAPVLEYEALEKTNAGPAFSAELERTAEAFAKYRMSFGSRFFIRRAAEQAASP